MAILIECVRCHQNHTVPAQSAQPQACPWCGAISAPIRIPASLAAGGFPELSPSRFPRRRRSLPSLVWLGVGLGLGACVALFAVVVWLPADSNDIRAKLRPVLAPGFQVWGQRPPRSMLASGPKVLRQRRPANAPPPRRCCGSLCATS